jgi:hypothetical protein
MRPDLVAWQWEHYTRNHRDKQNLFVHALTVPLFHAGTLTVLMAPLTSWAFAISGLALCGFAVSAQGRGHAREAEKPLAFEGPLDAVARIVVEQWVTFPRYMLSGAFVRAWREAS